VKRPGRGNVRREGGERLLLTGPGGMSGFQLTILSSMAKACY